MTEREPYDARTPPVKLACATCIQGHRASTCKHQDGSKGPLLVVKRRGRPLSQCQVCREKRVKTGRHTRCLCDTKTRGQRTKPVHIREESAPSSHSPLSFAHLLNPCRCKTTGICTCCETNTFSTCAKDECSVQCTSCGPDASDSDKSTAMKSRDIHESVATKAASSSCPTKSGGLCQSRQNPNDSSWNQERCDSPKRKQRKLDSMEITRQVTDMTQPYTPPCTCGDSCRCTSCVSHGGESVGFGVNVKERTSERGSHCMTCVACDIDLRNVSGISSVDSFVMRDPLPRPPLT